MAEPTTTVRVSGSQFRFDGEQYFEGDELDVPDRIVERHPNTLTPAADVGDSDGDADEDEDEITADDLDPHPSELTVDELDDRVSDLDDAALLETIWDAEAESKNRDTALDAIDSRLNELEE